MTGKNGGDDVEYQGDEPREMTARIDDVHYDEEGRLCEVTDTAPRSSQIHLVLQPIGDKSGWKKQHWFIYDSSFRYSSAWEVTERFMELNVIDEKDIAKAKGNMSIFKLIAEKVGEKPIKFTEKVLGRADKPNWYPKEIKGG